MRRADPRIKLPPARLTELHKRRLALYHGLTQARRVLMRDGCESCATGLLKRTLEEKIARTVLDVFMLLGLRYRPEDIRSAWFGIRSGDRHRKASVAEFLEQILDEPERSLMRPLTGDGTDAELQAAGRRDFGLDLSSESAALEYLIGLDDPWLRACAVYHAGTHGDGSLRRLAVDRLNDASPLVREAASLAKAG